MQSIGGFQGLVGAVLVLWLAACGGAAPPSPPPHALSPALGQSADVGQSEAADDHAGHANEGLDLPAADPLAPPDDRSENPGIGGDFPVVTAGAAQHRVRLIHQTLADRVFAVWNDLTANGTWRVIGRVVNAQGGVHGALKVIATDVEYRNAPGAAYDPATGRSLMVWGTETGDVRGRLLDENGEGGPLLSIATEAPFEVEPAVGFDVVTHRYLVAWIEAGPGFIIYTRAVDAEGGALGPAVPIADIASGKLDLQMAVDRDTGSFLVVWRDYRGTDLYSIRGRIVDATGHPTSDELVIGDAMGEQIHPRLAYDAGSRSFLVTWSDTRRTGFYELFGQVVASPDGLLIGENVFLSSFGGYEHQVEADAAGSRYLLLYAKHGRRIAARYLESDGQPQGDEILLSSVDGRQGAPQAVFDLQRHEFLAAWHDDREGATHLFGRRIDTDGEGSDPIPSPPVECPGFLDPEGVCLGCEETAGPLVDQACPVDAGYSTHGEYLACVTAAVNALRDEGRIGAACKVHLIAPRARSSVAR